MLRNAFFLCSLLLSSVVLVAQIPDQDVKAYQQAREGIVLLDNSDQLLPLQGLDTLRPVVVNVGLENIETFYQTLNTYVPTAHATIDENGSTVVNWPQGHDGLPPNLLILALGPDVASSAVPDLSVFFKPEKLRVVSCLFGRSVYTHALDKATNVLFSKMTTPWAQSLMAQALFGAIDLKNSLQEDLNKHFMSGAGVSMSACQRLAFAPSATIGMDEDILQDSIRSIIEEGRVHRAFPGAQVMVVKSGTVVYHETFGYHSDRLFIPVRKTDIYDLASVTKTSSALAALMRWYGQGQFELDAPLSRYYPAAKGSNKANLSFRTMLAHQARLRPWIPYWQNTLRGNGRYPWSRRYEASRTNDYRFKWRTFQADSSRRFPIYVADDLWLHRTYQQRMEKAILKSPLLETAAYRYSGLLFYLLPQIVAEQSGQDYETYLKDTFYRPLGAHTLTFNPLRFFPKSRIIPTERDTFFRMIDIHGHVHDEGAAMMGGVSANAGLFANAYDLAKLWQMYLNGGYYGGQRFIDSTALAEFTRCQYCETGNRRGLGFDKPLITYDAQASSVAKAASPASFGHSGYTGTFVWADPDTELLYIFLSNRVYPTRANRGIYIHNIRPRIHAAIYEALNAE